MDADTWMRAKALYFELAALPPAEREAEIQSRCPGDHALQRQVRSLLQHADAPEGFLETPVMPAAVEAARAMTSAPDDLADLPEGARVGPYRIQSLIGAGGMGSVYSAARADGQFDQLVAIKVVKKGLDTAEVVERFRRERQLLAGLNHPNIATLLDGGVTDDGRPYLVMEHVTGEPIDRYSEQHHLPIDARLRLFCKVCGAVHFAHQNLVVHRDLKPGNILVTAEGEPKLLDFGIAKLLHPEAAERPEQTIAERRVLTPGFASPEQVMGHPVSTASDVYSLGVVLYHILTGMSPYQFRSHTHEEVRRLVCETAPINPTIAARHSDALPPDTARRLRGDLENIVLMAMRKEPQRRYASVDQLAADIQRHLTGHPVIARPDTFGYRASKFLRRNAPAVTAAALVLLAILAGAGGVAWQAHLARVQKDRAVLAKTQAERTKEFLRSVFESANAFSGPGHDVTVREVLADAAARAEEELAEEPAVLADALGTIGAAFASLGAFDDADPLLERALAVARTLPPESANLVTRLNDLATLRYNTQDLEQAERLTREALDAETASAGRTTTNAAVTLNNLGAILRAQGRLDEAETVLREALAVRTALLGPDDPEVAQTLNNLASMLNSRGDFAHAAELLQQSLDIRRRTLGDEHPLVAQSMSNLAIVYHRAGELQSAAPLYSRAIELQRHSLGPDHPDLASVVFAYAMLRAAGGEDAEAEPLFLEAESIQRSFMEPADPRLLGTRLERARCLSRLGRHDEAIQTARSVLAAIEPTDPAPPRTHAVAKVLAEVYTAAGRADDAAAVLNTYPAPPEQP
ncbi:MAG: serine/threonine protein kinase [Phycisphaerales bacterium]|nr:serine/threonine protein kinase [Phycisphaerales bacterium]